VGQINSTKLSAGSFEFHEPFKPVGHWQIGPGNVGILFPVYEKPTDEQIKNTEELLGWKWKDS